MNLISQGESSGGLLVQPAKRRRGRPRRDPSLKHAAVAARVSPGFEGVKEYLPQRADRSVGPECMVGQAVTGVVEATFDAGYLLNVRIGDSNTNLRGVVFKPGHYVPITTDNDVAPHVQMMRRNEVHFTAESQGRSCGQNLAMQTAATVPSKQKYVPWKTAPSVPPVSVGGSVDPAVLEPVSFPSRMLTSDHENEDVHMVEPLSMLPPDQSIPVGWNLVSTQSHSGDRVAPGSEQDGGSSYEGSLEDKSKPRRPIAVDTPGPSSETPDGKIEDGKVTFKSSAEDLIIDSKQALVNANEPLSTESSEAAFVIKPLFKYGTGRMTELLQAVQENVKETQVQIAGPPSSATGAGFNETVIKIDPEMKPASHDSNA